MGGVCNLQDMTPTLETILVKVKSLPPQEQDRLASVITEFTYQSGEHETLLKELENTDYQAHLEAELAKGQADLKAGRTTPMGQALGDMKERFKSENGL